MKTYLAFFLFVFSLFVIACDKGEDSKDCGLVIDSDCYAYHWKEFINLDTTVDGVYYYHEYFSAGSGKVALVYGARFNQICLNSNLVIDLGTSVKPTADIDFLQDFTINGEPFNINRLNDNGLINGRISKTLIGKPVTKIEITNTLLVPNQGSREKDSLWYQENVIYHGMTIHFQKPK